MPQVILSKIYNSSLSFNKYIEYDLEDKSPKTCLTNSDRKIVEKFGLEKSKKLDWELLNKYIYNSKINLKEKVLELDEESNNLNEKLYELVKNEINPNDYSQEMKKIYSDRFFVILIKMMLLLLRSKEWDLL